MHACSCCSLTAQGYTGGCNLLLRLNVAILQSVFVSLLDSAAIATARSCPSIKVCNIQTLCVLVVAVVWQHKVTLVVVNNC
jgi:hypothetical protein